MPTAKGERAADETQRSEALACLWEEFHRLNREFFDNTLRLDEIRLSTRKQYGGYYKRIAASAVFPEGKHQIVLSWPAHREHGWEETLHTFRHEVAHIVHPNHSKAFWVLAARLGCTRRYALPPATRAHAYCRYVYECPACQGRVFRRKRLVRASCGRCDTAFNPRFQLRLVPQPRTASETAGRRTVGMI